MIPDSDAATGVGVHLSVVMPTFNRRDQVIRAVQALAQQQIDVPFEIVVVSDGSTDGSVEALGGMPLSIPLRIFGQENQGPAAARNHGVAQARGELVVFIDDDLVAADGLLQSHADAHRRLGPLAVVVGPMLDPPGHRLQPWVRWEQSMLRKQYASMEAGEWEPTPRQFYTGNASVLRRHIVEAGGFDTEFRRAEDVELAYRLDDAGLSFHYLPEAVGYHYAQRSFDSWRVMATAYGHNDVVFARDRGRDWILPFMAFKYGQHRRPLRLVIDGAVRWPAFGRAAAGAFGLIATVADLVSLERLASAAYSCIYGIDYHLGAAVELGGGQAFFDIVKPKQRESAI